MSALHYILQGILHTEDENKENHKGVGLSNHRGKIQVIRK
jgi:hypothetical protein